MTSPAAPTSSPASTSSTQWAPPSSYSPEMRFKQYKLMVESVEHNSDRRERAQTFYITVHTSLLTLIAVVAGYGLLTFSISGNTVPLPGTKFLTQAQAPVILVVSVIGLFLCWNWWRHLGAFKRLSAAKFTVINEIEKSLPYSAFDAEWTALEQQHHTDFTTIERLVPWVVAVLYILIAVTYFVLTQVLH